MDILRVTEKLYFGTREFTAKMFLNIAVMNNKYNEKYNYIVKLYWASIDDQLIFATAKWFKVLLRFLKYFSFHGQVLLFYYNVWCCGIIAWLQFKFMW